MRAWVLVQPKRMSINHSTLQRRCTHSHVPAWEREKKSMKQEFLAKAKENLTVAKWSHENGHYNASANRAYYAAFQAAIAALVHTGIITTSRISHSATQSLFATELIRRRKVYPSHLKSYLMDLQRVRDDADYEYRSVSKKKALTQFKQAFEAKVFLKKKL